MRGDERLRATVAIGDREHLIGQGQCRARLAPQISAPCTIRPRKYIESAAPLRSAKTPARVYASTVSAADHPRVPLHHIAQSHLQSQFAAVPVGRFRQGLERRERLAVVLLGFAIGAAFDRALARALSIRR